MSIPPDQSSEWRVGLLGTNFMGRAHSRAYYLLPSLEDPPVGNVVLEVICGRNPQRRTDLQRRFGWRRATEDWRELVEDRAVGVFDNAASNDLHLEPTMVAASLGKHVICEKPLGRNAEEAGAMLAAVREAGVVHMCAFNYRFFPAVRLARSVIRDGQIGAVRQFRSRFLLSSGDQDGSSQDDWRLRRDLAGSGVVGDLLAHHIDLARYLVDEIISVSALTRIWDEGRAGRRRDVEDSAIALVEFAGGAAGVLEATSSAPGHVLDSIVEVDGEAGSVRFNLRHLNELTISNAHGEARVINVTEEHHPYIDLWWPRGQGLGWGDSFVHEIRHFIGAVAGAWSVAPDGATFEDGYQAALVCDAVLDAAQSGERVSVPIRPFDSHA